MEHSIALRGPCADQTSEGFGLVIVRGELIGAARIPAVLCVSADSIRQPVDENIK
jgi:hypothetical protein